MITALMILACAVMIFAWLVAAGVFVGMIVTGIVSLVYRVREQPDGRSDDAGSPELEPEFRETDVEFLHEVGIEL